MSTSFTRKRPRSDTYEEPEDAKPDLSDGDTLSHGQSTQPTRKKDEEFWFSDGTVILHAGDVELRVYRGLLEARSTVFTELFAQSHSTRNVTIAGQQFTCPVVRLTDSVQDLRHVLRGCMPRHAAGSLATFLGSPSVTPSFHAVSAALRLGQKYKIDDMYQAALSFLKRHYTDSLDIWLDEVGSWLPPGWDDLHAIGVANLARSTGELSLLPTALLVCVVQLQANIVHGFAREDGSREHLTADDMGRCWDAKDLLREACVMAHFRVLTPTVAPTCRSSVQCAKALTDVFRSNKMEENVSLMMLGDVFLNSSRYYDTEDGTCALCHACATMVRERDEKENRALWHRLPQLLGIEIPLWGEPAEAAA